MSTPGRERATPSRLSYQQAHRLVRASRGPASDHRCAECGGPACDWAYQHARLDPLTSEGGAPYSDDPADYAPMCRSCHLRLDNEATPETGRARRDGSRTSARALAVVRRSNTPEGERLREVSRANARGWSAEVSRHRREDPEFDEKMRAHHQRLGQQNVSKSLAKAWALSGPRGSTKTNQMRRRCLACGKISTPGPMSRHLAATGHQEATDA